MKQPQVIKNLKHVQSRYGYTNAQMVEKINAALRHPILPTEQAYCKLKNVTSSNRYEHRQNAMLNCVELALRIIDRRQRWLRVLENEVGITPSDEQGHQAFLVVMEYMTTKPESQAYTDFCKLFKVELRQFKNIAARFLYLFENAHYYDYD